MAFELPDLPYAYDALAPYMSAETLEFHHDKHHLAYVNNGNNLLKGSEWEGQEPRGDRQGLLRQEPRPVQQCRPALQPSPLLEVDEAEWRWQQASRQARRRRSSRDIGGYDKLREAFVNAGVTQFGSGWCWLAVKDGKLEVMKTPNGENPLVHGATPILGCDVWEHSYYIDYRNRRPDYLAAWVDHLVNWEYVEELFEAAS